MSSNAQTSTRCPERCAATGTRSSARRCATARSSNGIEAETFEIGAPMSAAVTAALPQVAARVREEAARLG
jgi:hypothetical protein